MNSYIKVTYDAHATSYTIRKALLKLAEHKILSFDTETQSIYSLEERAEAKSLLKNDQQDMSRPDIKLSKMVAKSSGLSYPEIVKVTHFIFGVSKKHSVILIAHDLKTELLIMNWVVDYEGKLIVHNFGFDGKLIYNRTGRFPKDMEDTQLLAKCLINNCDIWKAKTGLKELMGDSYNPRWTMIDTYDVQDYKEETFLRYCAIDGASTFHLWEDLQEHLKD